MKTNPTVYTCDNCDTKPPDHEVWEVTITHPVTKASLTGHFCEQCATTLKLHEIYAAITKNLHHRRKAKH